MIGTADPRHDTEESAPTDGGRRRRADTAGFGWRRLLSMALSVAIVTSAVGAGVGGLTGTAEAASAFGEDEMQFCDDPVVERVDEDGDGHASSFKICVSADTMIKDGTIGKKDIPRNHSPVVNEGHPKFAYFGVIEQNGKKKVVLLGIKEVEPADAVKSVGIEKEISLLETRSDRDIFLDDAAIRDIEVMYVESDSSPDALVSKDVDTLSAVESGVKGGAKIGAGVALLIGGAVPAGIMKIGSASGDVIAVGKSIDKSWSSDDHIDTDSTALEDPITLEKPSDDTNETVRVTSNVDNAEVAIDGETVGTTPWSGEFPVDAGEREGPTTITVRKDGYVTESKSVRLSPPETINVQLEKVTQPITITAASDGSTVKLDGQTVGTTPWSGERWVKGSYDITVEDVKMSSGGRMDRSFQAVSPPRTINASTVSTGSGGLDFGPGSTPGIYDFDSIYVDPLADVPEFDFTPVVSANVSASPDRSTVGQPITFDASNSFAYQNLTFEWDYGDGTTERLSDPVTNHSYASPGTYQVRLTVSDGEGNSDSATTTVTVEDAAPTAQFVTSSQTPITGKSVTFDASASSDPEGSIVRYAWDFDGDGRTDATGRTVNYAYANAGTYVAELSVTDSANNVDTVSRQIDVQLPNAAPQAGFDVSDRSVGTGETLTLDAAPAQDPDGSIQSYTWEFGDGTQTNGETVTHSYDSAGTYQVRLLVTDDRGEIATTTESITVTAAGSTDQSTPTPTETPVADEPDAPATPTAGDTPTPSDPGTPDSPDTETPDDPGTETPESPGTETPEPPEPEPPNPPGLGPGFVILVLVLALLGLALLAVRRRY